MQQRPAIPYFVMFTLLGYHELATFVQVWRAWIQFARRRRLWKAFAAKFAKTDDVKVAKAKYFFALKRAAETKVLWRITHVPTFFLQQISRYPYEPMMEFVASRKVLIEGSHWDFTTQLPARHIEAGSTY
jgi:hypothetical protein